MKINVEYRLLASGYENTIVELGNPVSVSGLLKEVGVEFDDMLCVLVNGRYYGGGRMLEDGDIVSVFPPVARRVSVA